jgi:ankyrin repeat protein
VIVLRHPKWRVDDPYQDIPITVFTRSQWESDQQGRFGIGAGGFDLEMWHNQKYVFGMSTRYNAADGVKGWKEVADIVERNRVAIKMPRLQPSGGGIHEAARAGDLEKVKALLEDNPDLVFSKDNLDETPLHYAAIFGGKGVAELLLANKTKVNAKDINGETPLHWAAYSGHKDVAELLLANKAEVNAKDTNGLMPLHLAARLGHKDVAALLLASNADVNAKEKHGWTPLHFAVFDGRKEVVELLLASKAKVNAKGTNGWTPLHCAAASGSTHAAELLRQHGGHE